ncbi:putative transmembrane protein [Anoplolepis gracilipes virus 3]|nr:putative transmembrane protein [Anoplolepis gracilipes virus 3]
MLPGLQIQFTNLPKWQEYRGMIRSITGILTQKVYFPLARILLMILFHIGPTVNRTYQEFVHSGQELKNNLRKMHLAKRRLRYRRLVPRPNLESLLPLWQQQKPKALQN